MDYYVGFFYKPFTWKIYDDLHKNIKDEEKYTWIDSDLFNTILEKKPELRQEVIKNEKFKILQNKIKKYDTNNNFVTTSLVSENSI